MKNIIVLWMIAIAISSLMATAQELQPNSLIIFSGDVKDVRQTLTNLGIRPLHIFPPNALIAYQPLEVLDDELLQNPHITEIAHANVDWQRFEVYGDEAKYAAIIFNGLQEPHIPVPVGQTPENDAWIPPDYDLAIGRSGIDIEPDGGPSQTETSLFFIRDASVNIILPESSGQREPNTEDWTQDEINQVLTKVVQGLNWHIPREPRANAAYVYHLYMRTPTGYEPINHPSTEEGLWIGEILANLGYSQQYMTAVRSFDHATRQTDRTDWGFTIFVVDSSNDPDGRFTDGYFAYAYLAGPFLVMTYDNNGWTINNMNMVTAHETAHIFQADDEYFDSNRISCSSTISCTRRTGFLSVENQNCDLSPISRSCLLNVDSIMRDSASQQIAYPNGLIDFYARGKIGWWDQDSDIILDPIDSTYNQGSDIDYDGIVDYWDNCPVVPSTQNAPCPYNWSQDIRVTQGAESFGHALVADRSGNLHIVWSDGRSGMMLVHKKISNDGHSLTSERRVSLSVYEYVNPPAIGTDEQGNVHVIWDTNYNDPEMYYKKLNSNGQGLTQEIRIGRGFAPSLAVDLQGNVHIVWADKRDNPDNPEIYYKKLDNNGQPLTQDIRLTTNPAASMNPAIAIDHLGNVHVVWDDERDNPGSWNFRPYYKKLDNGGQPLTQDIRISLGFGGGTKIDKDPRGNLHVVWQSESFIMHTKLDNNGLNVTPEIRVTPSLVVVGYPDLATDPQGNVHITWIDDPNGEMEIFYRKLDNNGQILTPITRLTFDPEFSMSPMMAVDSNGIAHIVWMDTRDGTGELYYKRSFPKQTVFLQEPPRIGSEVNVKLFDQVNVNRQYLLAMSSGSIPGITLSDGRIIPLNPDGIFLLSLTSPSALGLIDSQGTLRLGQGRVTWRIPNIPELAGLTLYIAFVTFNPSLPSPQAITSISPATAVKFVA